MKDSAPDAQTIDSTGMEQGQCFEEYLEDSRDVYDVFATPAGIRNMRMRATARWSNGFDDFSEFKASAHAVKRHRYHLNRSPIEAIRVRVYREGMTHIRFGDDCAVLPKGYIHFVDYARAQEAVSVDVDQLSFFITHEILGYDPLRHKPSWSLPLDSPVGRILGPAIDAVHGRSLNANSFEWAEAIHDLHRLVAVSVKETLDSQLEKTLKSKRRSAMRAWLIQRLDDPEVGLASLQNAFGASRATIFRDFADVGGVQQFITEQRLSRALEVLTQAEPSRGIVARTAEAMCFSSAGNFSRAFLARFHCRPGEVVGMTDLKVHCR